MMIHRNSTLRFSRTPRFLRLAIIAAILIALIAPMNFVLITPGPATKLFPKVLGIKESDGVRAYPVHGQLNLLTIYITNPESWVPGVQVLGCWVWGDCVALPRSVMYQDGATDQDAIKSGNSEMKQSQNIALVAAKRVIAEKFPSVDISSVTDSSVAVDLANTGGPSGGLIFTLGLIDLLTPVDLIAGRNIAGTGTIARDGSIGAIGGITEKILGAKKAGASLLFISTENCGDLPAHVDGISVIAISNVGEAVAYLLQSAQSGGQSGKVRGKALNSAGIHGCASVGA